VELQVQQVMMKSSTADNKFVKFIKFII
jgi:hypothetical protein